MKRTKSGMWHDSKAILSIAVVIILVIALLLFYSPVQMRQSCNRPTTSQSSLAPNLTSTRYTEVADSPIAGEGNTGQADAGSDVVCGNLYVVGGYGSSSADRLDVVSVYSPNDNTWRTGPAYPVKAWGLACSAIGTSLFCFGGDGAGVRAYRLDTRASAWSRLKDMPNGYNNSEGQVAVADPSDSRVFIMGSSSNLEVNRTTLVYDVVHDSYVRKSDMPHGSGWFVAALYHGRIYAIGGTHGNQVSMYNIANDTWTQLPVGLPGPPWFGMIRNPGVYLGFIPIVDGKKAGTTFFNMTYFYDMVENRFVKGPDTLLPRDGIAGGVIGDTLYVVGGRSNRDTPRGLTLSEELNLSYALSNQSA